MVTSAGSRWAERLSRWLAEWKIDQALAAAGETTAGEPSQIGGCRVVTRLRRGRKVRQGDIWLLPPCGEASARPLCVAVLAVQDGPRALVAPFGRFSEPALPGEWATRRKAPMLRVLCVWNRRWIPQEFIRSGWRVGRLSPRAIERCHTLIACPASPDRIPVWVERETGPPLRHPADPRWVYQSEEASLMEDAVRAAESLAQGVSSASECRESGWYSTRDRGLRRAAEDHAPYGAERGGQAKLKSKSEKQDEGSQGELPP